LLSRIVAILSQGVMIWLAQEVLTEAEAIRG